MKSNVTKKQKATGSRYPLGVTTKKGKVVLFFKASYLGKIGLYLSKGKTGISFDKSRVKINMISAAGKPEKIDDSDNICVSPFDDGYYMTFTQKGKRSQALMGACSKDLKRFKVIGKISSNKKRGILTPNYKHDGKYLMYLSGEESIYAAFSKNLKTWAISDVSCLTPRSAFFDCAPLNVLSVSLTSHGILVVYDASYKKIGKHNIQIGAALFSLSDPNNIIWRSETPLWQEEFIGEKSETRSIGAAFYKERIFLYFLSESQKLLSISLPRPFPSIKEKRGLVNLKRFYNNPIITPDRNSEWQSQGTFNPAALYDDGKVHLLFRAVGMNGMSCFGYASTKDGFNIDEVSSEPAYLPRKEFEGISTAPSRRSDIFRSGGGWGGCEDPKLTAIDNRVYLTYVAFNGYAPPRVALSSIGRNDFLQQKWNWTEPQLISAPGVVNKSGCIMPEKIKGKYVTFHRVFPNILIDYRDELCFNNGKWLEATHQIPIRPHMWDSRKLSVGATPIKTSDGWLVIYHAVDDRDSTRYKIGAMILDLEDPSKVLYRTSNPILEPDEHYENDWKPGIAYPCGAVVLKDELFVYYGGGDKFVCCATAQLTKFIKGVKKDKSVDYTIKEVSYT